MEVMPEGKIDLAFRAMAECAEEAVLDSMCCADAVTGFEGHHVDSLADWLEQLKRKMYEDAAESFKTVLDNYPESGSMEEASMGLGKALHWFVMEQIKVDLVSFDKIILPTSYLYSIVLTFVFACIVNLVMFSKLEKINMAESLKSIE